MGAADDWAEGNTDNGSNSHNNWYWTVVKEYFDNYVAPQFEQEGQEGGPSYSPEEIEEMRYLSELLAGGTVTQEDMEFIRANYPELYEYVMNSEFEGGSETVVTEQDLTIPEWQAEIDDAVGTPNPYTVTGIQDGDPIVVNDETGEIIIGLPQVIEDANNSGGGEDSGGGDDGGEDSSQESSDRTLDQILQEILEAEENGDWQDVLILIEEYQTHPDNPTGQPPPYDVTGGVVDDPICEDENSSTYGSLGECGPCNDGFKKQNGICVPDTSTLTCGDENSSTYGEPGECGPCNSGFVKEGGVCVPDPNGGETTNGGGEDEPCPENGDINNANCYEAVDDCIVVYKPTGARYDICNDTTVDPDGNVICGDYERVTEPDANGCFTARCRDGGANDGKEYEVCLDTTNGGGTTENPDGEPCPENGDINNANCYEAIDECTVVYKPTGARFNICDDTNQPKIGDPCNIGGVEGTLQPDPDQLGMGHESQNLICVPNETVTDDGTNEDEVEDEVEDEDCPAGQVKFPTSQNSDGTWNYTCVDNPFDGVDEPCPPGQSKDATGKCVPDEGPEGCNDPTRQTNADGSCGDCASGYIENESGNCVEECTDPDAVQNPEGGCGDCNVGFIKNPVTGECVEDPDYNPDDPDDPNPEGCQDPNAQENADGSCGECNEGYVRDPRTGLCEPAEEITLCGDPNAEVDPETGRCGECKPGFKKDSAGLCQPDQGGCSDPNAVQNADGTCGECLDGFSKDENGNCQQDPGGTCNDPNAQTNPDGSCGECNEGFWKNKTTGQCVGECDDPNAVQNADGGCGDCQPGFAKNSEGRCVGECADANRVQAEDGGCGECKEGFTENAEGVCEEGDGPGEGIDCADYNRQPNPFAGFATTDPSQCGDCLEGYEEDENGNCVESQGTCDDPNSSTYGQIGECGECNDGFVFDVIQQKCVGDGNDNGNDDGNGDGGGGDSLGGDAAALTTGRTNVPAPAGSIESYEYSGPLDELMRELGIESGNAGRPNASIGASAQEAELDAYIDDLIYGNGAAPAEDDTDIDAFLKSLGI